MFSNAASAAFEACGALENGYGPYDYWTDKGKLGLVEHFHFTPKVENLRSGESSYIGGDLDYTLRAFPNHARALNAMVKLSEREKTDKPIGALYTISCYFERAIRFRPEDSTARVLYGAYLSKKGRYSEALAQLQVAEENAEDNSNVHYNIGLIYFDLKNYDKSLAHAHRAYSLGFPLMGLKQKLQRSGKWKDPVSDSANSGVAVTNKLE